MISGGQTMRGLLVYITEIRNCKSKDQEQERVQKELNKIRQKFNQTKQLNRYQLKKYVWKLLYSYILGYEVDFGFQEAAKLITADSYSEKYTGYISLSILNHLAEESIYQNYITKAIEKDLQCKQAHFTNLALSMISSVAPNCIVKKMGKQIQTICFSQSYQINIRKRAILTLLRLFRKNPENFVIESWIQHIIDNFHVSKIDLGFISANSSLVLGICQISKIETFNEIIVRLISILKKIILQPSEILVKKEDHQYNKCVSPWLQIKILKILQLYPAPSEADAQKNLVDVLKDIINKRLQQIVVSENRKNIENALMFEAANLVIHYKENIPSNLQQLVLKVLGQYVQSKENSNVQYLCLETMCKLSFNNEKQLEQYIQYILKSLKSPDISIKRRALDLLYLMCTQNNAKKIVEELLGYAETWNDYTLKEELVLKIAILAERFGDDLIWYLDTVIDLCISSGEYINEDIWFRIIQIVIGFKEGEPEVQKYAAQKLYKELNVPFASVILIKIGSFILSEFCDTLNKTPQQIYDVLYRHFNYSKDESRSMLISAFSKLGAKYPDLKDQSQFIFESQSDQINVDLQQRSCEFNYIFNQPDNVINKLLTVKQLPFSEIIKENNPLLKRIYKIKLGNQKDKDETLKKEAQRNAESEIEKLNKNNKVKNKSDGLENHLQMLKDSPYFNQCESRVAISGINIIQPTSSFTNWEQINNQQEIKQLISRKEGTIFTNEYLKVQIKSEFKDCMGKVLLQFEAKEQLTNLQLMIQEGNGVEYNIQQVNYKQFPEVMIYLNCIDPNISFPQANVFFDMGGKNQKISFFLPIMINKFLQFVNMPEGSFDQAYEEYTFSSNNSYFKIDDFINSITSSPQQSQSMMKMMGSLLNQVLNLKVMSKPSDDNIQQLSAVGQFNCKQGEKIVKLPILVQIQLFSDLKKLRVSLRGVIIYNQAGSSETIKNIYKVIRLLFQSQ